ncbi:MAG: hypothetical protein AB8G95_25160 [Anaerolineae bacterium]
MQNKFTPFSDMFKLNRHALHHWLLRIGIFFIFAGLVALLFNVENRLDIWFIIVGLGLSALGLVRWFASGRPHWNWIAITFFSLSGLIGIFIYLVLIGVLLPLPAAEPAAVAAGQTSVEPAAIAESDATAVFQTPTTASLAQTSTAIPTGVPTKKKTKSSAQPTETIRPTLEPTVEILAEPALTAQPTLMVVVGPTITPTPEVVKTRYLHFVQPDENLTCIAINYLGSDRYVPQICKFSQEFGLIGDDCGEFLAPGRRIVIPTSLVPGYEAIPKASLPPHNPNACLTEDEKSE